MLRAAAAAVTNEGWCTLAKHTRLNSVEHAKMLILAADSAQHSSTQRYFFQPTALCRLESFLGGRRHQGLQVLRTVQLVHILLTLNLASGSDGSGRPSGTVDDDAGPGTVSETVGQLAITVADVGAQAVEQAGYGDKNAVALFQLVNGLLSDTAVWRAVLSTELILVPKQDWPVEAAVKDFAKELSLLRRRLSHTRAPPAPGGAVLTTADPAACISAPNLAAGQPAAEGSADAAVVEEPATGLHVADGGSGLSSSQRKKAAKRAKAVTAAAAANALMELSGPAAPALASLPDAQESPPARARAAALTAALAAEPAAALAAAPAAAPAASSAAARLTPRPAVPQQPDEAAAPATAASTAPVSQLVAPLAPPLGLSRLAPEAAPVAHLLPVPTVVPSPSAAAATGASATTQTIPRPISSFSAATAGTQAATQRQPMRQAASGNHASLLVIAPPARATPPFAPPPAALPTISSPPHAAQASTPAVDLSMQWAAAHATGMMGGQAVRHGTGQAAGQAAGQAEVPGASEDLELAGLLALLMVDAPLPASDGSSDALHQHPGSSSRAQTPPGGTRLVPPAPRPAGVSAVAQPVPQAALAAYPAGLQPHVPPAAQLPVPPTAQAAPPVVVPPAEVPEPPPDLCCPITMALLVDPVLADDGNLYSRSAIETWLQKSSLSPMTGQPLASKRLTPCRPVYSMVQAWCEAHGVPPP